MAVIRRPGHLNDGPLQDPDAAGVDEGMVVTETPPKRQLPDVIETSDDGDRPSITEVNGTVARFEMAYSPPEKGDRVVFGPPISQRIPSFVYLGFALLVTLAVLLAYQNANGRLYVWIVEGDRGRPVGSVPLAGLILLSAVGTLIRAGLRGVVVTADGVEARYLLALGVPRIKRWSWAQIDRLVVDDDDVLLELWDGTYERLPKVREQRKLAGMLEAIAIARGRQVTRLPPKATKR